MTQVFFVKTTESYEVSLVTINGQTSITLGMAVSFVKCTESYEVCRLGHHLNGTFTGMHRNGPNYRILPPNYRIGPDYAGRA